MASFAQDIVLTEPEHTHARHVLALAWERDGAARFQALPSERQVALGSVLWAQKALFWYVYFLGVRYHA